MRWKSVLVLSAFLVAVTGCGKGGGKPVAASLASSTTPTVSSGSNTTTRPPSATNWVAVKLNHDELAKEQDGEKEGHRVSLLLPDEVATDFAHETAGLSAFDKGKLNDQHFAKDANLELSIDQATLRLHLVQPIQQGKFGIWAVDRYQIVN